MECVTFHATKLFDQNERYSRHLAMIFPSRSQLIRELSLTRTDQMEISKRRGDPQRLGFAYQLGVVRVFQRFPVQQPLEICEELLSFVALPCSSTSARSNGTTSFSTASTSSIAPWSAKERVLMLYFNTNVGATLYRSRRSAAVAAVMAVRAVVSVAIGNSTQERGWRNSRRICIHGGDG